MSKATRTVEYYRLWDDHTWDTDYIEIPAETPEQELGPAVDKAAYEIEWTKDAPVAVGIYCSDPEGFDEEEPAVES